MSKKGLGLASPSNHFTTDQQDEHGELDLYDFTEEDRLFERLSTKDCECSTYEHLKDADIVCKVTGRLEGSAPIPEPQKDEEKPHLHHLTRLKPQITP